MPPMLDRSSLYIVTGPGTYQGVYYTLGRLIDSRRISLGALQNAGISVRAIDEQ